MQFKYRPGPYHSALTTVNAHFAACSIFSKRNGPTIENSDSVRLGSLNGSNFLHRLNHSKALHATWQFITLAAFFYRSIEPDTRRFGWPNQIPQWRKLQHVRRAGT